MLFPEYFRSRLECFKLFLPVLTDKSDWLVLDLAD